MDTADCWVDPVDIFLSCGVVMKKEATTFARHCEIFAPVKDGKATCPKCKASFHDGKWSKVEKRTHKKTAAGSIHDGFTARIGFGIVFMFIVPTFGASLIVRLGWDNLIATVAALSFLLGAALLGLFNEKGKKA